MHDLLVGAVIIVLIPIAVKFAVVCDNWTVKREQKYPLL